MSKLIFALLLLPFTVSAQLKRFQFTQNKMGSLFHIIFYHPDSAEAVQFANDCFLIVDSLNNVYSDYTVTSEIGRLTQKNISQNLRVSDELLGMILTSKQAWEKSDKAFDITIGALSQLWRKARKEKKFPSPAKVKKAKRSTGFEHLVVDTISKTISFKRKGMRFDFGGIVQGYAAQKVIDYLKGKNIHRALADAAGDIVTGDPPPGKNGWIIGINLPGEENEFWDQKPELSNCSVTTSGDVYQFLLHKGKRYSHIIDPRTGYGVTSQRNVTVIAKDGTAADWLATACSILPVEKALGLVKKENAALLITTLKDEKIITWKTENFDSYFQKKEL